MNETGFSKSKRFGVLSIVLYLILALSLFVPASAKGISPEREIIFIGDSRTVDMYCTVNGMELDDCNEVNLDTVNGYWDALYGAKIDWFTEKGIPQAEKVINSNSDVVILLGVNDLRKGKTPEEYIEILNKKSKEWSEKGANIYYCSVNPVDSDFENNKLYGITNKDVEKWNDKIKEFSNDELGYIDTYSKIIDDFDTSDGLHYTKKTYNKIYECILDTLKEKNQCDDFTPNDDYTGLAKKDDQWFYYENGEIKSDISGLVKVDDTVWLFENGKIKIEYNGLYCGEYDDKEYEWVIENGMLKTHRNGFYKKDGNLYLISDGHVDTEYIGAKKYKNKWLVFEKGQYNPKYFGMISNDFGCWYAENGIVDFSENGLKRDKITGDWYMLKNGKVDESYNDVIKINGDWLNFTNGKTNYSFNTVAENRHGWWKITNGKVDFSYNGYAANSNGLWNIKNGKVDFDANGVLKDFYSGEWYLTNNGKVQKDINTVAENKNGWWHIKCGKVDFSSNTVAENAYGWWKITNGKVDFSYNGYAANSNGLWNIKNGKVDFEANGVLKDNYTGDWYYTRCGKVVIGESTVESNKNGWWKIGENGKVDFGFNGFANNRFGTWKCKNGKVDFSYNGSYKTADGTVYKCKNGKVDYLNGFSGIIKNNGVHYRCENGKINFDKPITNSELAKVRIPTSHHSGLRTSNINKITIHHMAGVMSAESCANYFKNTKTSVSSNYVIGNDGTIGINVDEWNRSWCSANEANDQEAVTIEVSNSQRGGDWPVSDAAYNALIDLCTDICRRNGFRLQYTGDRYGTLNCHKFLWPTECPGPYLSARLPNIANEVNRRLDA